MTSPKKAITRPGLTIMELAISLGMLSALCVLIAQWFVFTAAQQVREQEQRWAMQTADNVMERVFAQPWDDLTQESSAVVAMSAIQATDQYQCAMEITELPTDDAGLRSKRIWLSLSHRAGRFPPVELVAWRHARETSP